MAEGRSTYTIVFDKGLDKASRPFEGDPSRALDEINYIHDSAMVRKRFGYEQLLKAEPLEYRKVNFDGTSDTTKTEVNPVNWNGVWRFKAEDGVERTIAHVGKLLFEVAQDASSGQWSLKPIEADISLASPASSGDIPNCYEFLNGRSTAVIGANSLYFFGGNKFMRLRYIPSTEASYRTFTPVANGSGTYIPTTTISITYENAKTTGRQSLDQVNLLHDFRRNTLLSGVGYPTDAESITEHYEYLLDAPIVCADVKADMAKFRITLRERSED